ncbi:MAG TPA: hypothetical protein VM049_04020 [Gaiellaceae bacterium]|nr:hypothetical protein [Gaiellaceae bacterium]
MKKLRTGLVLAAALLFATNALAGSKLPPTALCGLAHLLDQYPTVSLASRDERVRADELLDVLRTAGMRWADPRGAARAGYKTKRPRRAPGNNAVMWFHAESRRFSNDRRYLDPRRPEVIIYADVPGRPLVLVGVMFSMPRGKHGATPGGPITRWHWHRVCARPGQRGLTPGPDGKCPRGASMRNGSEMMHIWFTRDLRSAFAIHAPVPELCVARLLPQERCGK